MTSRRNKPTKGFYKESSQSDESSSTSGEEDSDYELSEPEDYEMRTASYDAGESRPGISALQPSCHHKANVFFLLIKPQEQLPPFFNPPFQVLPRPSALPHRVSSRGPLSFPCRRRRKGEKLNRCVSHSLACCHSVPRSSQVEQSPVPSQSSAVARASSEFPFPFPLDEDKKGRD